MIGRLASVDWEDVRRKAWHLALTLAAAYAVVDPRFAWAVPVLTMAASQSTPPFPGGPR